MPCLQGPLSTHALVCFLVYMQLVTVIYVESILLDYQKTIAFLINKNEDNSNIVKRMITVVAPIVGQTLAMTLTVAALIITAMIQKNSSYHNTSINAFIIIAIVIVITPAMIIY